MIPVCNYKTLPPPYGILYFEVVGYKGNFKSHEVFPWHLKAGILLEKKGGILSVFGNPRV